MTPVRIGKMIGGTAAVLGTVWMGVVVFQVGRMAWKFWQDGATTAWMGVTAGILFFSLFATPGVLAAFFGVRLFRELRLSSLRWVVGTFSIVAASLLCSGIYEIPPSVMPQRWQSAASMLTTTLLAVGLYLLALRFLLPRLGAPGIKTSALIGRGALCAMAWMVWLLLSSLTRPHHVDASGERVGSMWILFELLGPIVIAYGAFRLAASRLPAPAADPFAPRPKWMMDMESSREEGATTGEPGLKFGRQ